MDGHQPKSDKPFDPETAVPPPSGTGVQPPPGDGSRMFKRTKMEVDGAYAIVEMIVQVKAESWGPDCTVGQAATQAVETATQKVHNLIHPPAGVKHNAHGVKLIGARCVRVVCEAKRDGR